MFVQCVIAWTEDSDEYTGEPYRVDLGERPEMRPVTVAKACVWLNKATPSEVERARRYAEANGGRVYTFTDEPDPLGAAKRAILKGA